MLIIIHQFYLKYFERVCIIIGYCLTIRTKYLIIQLPNAELLLATQIITFREGQVLTQKTFKNILEKLEKVIIQWPTNFLNHQILTSNVFNYSEYY